MGLKSAFGVDWAGFIKEWCLGDSPAFSESDADTAFGALERNWPERISSELNQPGRSPIMMAALVRDGLVVATSENLPGFAEVARRIRAGDKAAVSELKFATGLVRLAYSPSLEAPLAGRTLDSLIVVDGRPVYCEVISPDQSDAMCEVTGAMERLARSLVDDNAGACAEVYLELEPDEAVSLRVREAVRSAPYSAEVIELVGHGLFRKQDRAGGAEPLGIAPPDAPSPVLGVAMMKIHQGSLTSANIQHSMTDARGARLLEAEAKHFSKAEANLVVMDVTNVPNGIRAFAPLVQRRFQPGLNRRFGAVALFQEMADSSGRITATWAVLRNPYAFVPVPERLLTELESLSE